MAILKPEQARDALARIAEAEIGVREQGGSNRGPRIREYQSATWLEPGPWPWCAAFVCWCIREWLESPAVRNALGVEKPLDWRPQTARAFDFPGWAKKRKLQVLGEKASVRRGDIVVFDFSHIGFATKDASSVTAFLETVEGNTNKKGERDGDGVWAKHRVRYLACWIIRLI